MHSLDQHSSPADRDDKKARRTEPVAPNEHGLVRRGRQRPEKSVLRVENWAALQHS